MGDAKAEVRSESWIEAGLEEIARSGVEGVRVEVLAKNLGVTKGGFYRRFKDRAALLAEMLRSWSEGRIVAIEQQAALDGTSARELGKAGPDPGFTLRVAHVCSHRILIRYRIASPSPL